jgi:hypothetical protein
MLMVLAARTLPSFSNPVITPTMPVPIEAADLPIVVFALRAPTLTPLQSEIKNLLSDWSEVAVIRPEAISSLLNGDIYIMDSCSKKALEELRKSLAAVIVLDDDRPLHIPESWLVLPRRCSPSSIVQIIGALLAERTARSSKFESLMDSAIRAQVQKTWSTAAQAAKSFCQEDTAAGWVKVSTELLEVTVPGLCVRGWVGQNDAEYEFHGKHEDEPRASVHSKLANHIATFGNLIIADHSTSDAISRHLRLHNSSLLIPLGGRTKLMGWILLSFRERWQSLIEFQLLEQVAVFIQMFAQERNAVVESAAWRNSILSGLYQTDVGISILDRAGIPLLENRASRVIGSRLGHALNDDFEAVHQAIHSARSGEPTTTMIDEFTVRVSPWGSLQNGCVLETKENNTYSKISCVPLKTWITDFCQRAKLAGLQVTLPMEAKGDASLQVPAEFAMESLVEFLHVEGWSPKIGVSWEACSDGYQVYVDQESEQGRVTISLDAPLGTTVTDASIGRRLHLLTRLESRRTGEVRRSQRSLNRVTI